MRSYHVDIAEYVTVAERKWIDNILSHFDIPGVVSSRRGSPRRITPTGIYHIALARQITRELNTTLSAAVALAQRLLQSDAGELPVCRGLSLRFDPREFQAAIDLRIAEAVEAVVPARRGRPPKREAAAHR